jgi:hypothetical protein
MAERGVRMQGVLMYWRRDVREAPAVRLVTLAAVTMVIAAACAPSSQAIETSVSTETSVPAESSAPVEAVDFANASAAFRDCILGSGLSQESVDQVMNYGPRSLSSSEDFVAAQGCMDSSGMAGFVDANGNQVPDGDFIARINREKLEFDKCMVERGWPPEDFVYDDSGLLVPADEDDHGYDVAEDGLESFEIDVLACEVESGVVVGES